MSLVKDKKRQLRNTTTTTEAAQCSNNSNSKSNKLNRTDSNRIEQNRKEQDRIEQNTIQIGPCARSDWSKSYVLSEYKTQKKRVFYISLVLSNARRVLSQCNTRLRLLYLLIKGAIVMIKQWNANHMAFIVCLLTNDIKFILLVNSSL